jgi:hypothetical protein
VVNAHACGACIPQERIKGCLTQVCTLEYPDNHNPLQALVSLLTISTDLLQGGDFTNHNGKSLMLTRSGLDIRI